MQKLYTIKFKDANIVFQHNFDVNILTSKNIYYLIINNKDLLLQEE